MMSTVAEFGISASTTRALQQLFERTPKLDRVWLFGSRATGAARHNSDIDLAFEAATMSAADAAALANALEDLPTLYRIDAVRLQDIEQAVFRAEIERDRVLFWEPRAR